MPEPKYFVVAERALEDKATGLVTLVNLIDELRVVNPIPLDESKRGVGPFIEMALLSKWTRTAEDSENDVFEAKGEVWRPFHAEPDEPPFRSVFAFKKKTIQVFIIRLTGPLILPPSAPAPPFEYRVKVSVRKVGASVDEWKTDQITVPLKYLQETRD